MEKIFELSKRNRKNGRRKFKLVLHEIYSDDCIDRSKDEGTVYNENGITWIREYCEKQIDTIPGTSLRVEFMDENRTEICGHGDTGVVDGMPVFENATVIGTFNKGYIDTLNINGYEYLAMIGEGEIDASCYPALVAKLEQEIKDGNYPKCSVEICHTDEFDTIQYLGGYKEKGRIPTNFQYSGCALLGVTPADENAKLLELNRKEETMSEEEIRNLIQDAVEAYVSRKCEIDEKIAKANSTVEATKNELAACKEKQEEMNAKCASLEEENKALKEKCESLEMQLMACKRDERCSKLDEALSGYSEVEKEYAKSEINAFKEKEYKEIPNDEQIAAEINSVVNAVLIGIGKASKEKEAAEINSKKAEAEKKMNIDIFESVSEKFEENDYANIF